MIYWAPGVGKTSILQRCINNEFLDKHSPTLEDAYWYKFVLPDGRWGRFEIVDTSGLLEFPAMIDLRISQAHAVVVVYSIDDERSFLMAKSLCERVHEIRGMDFLHILLVGNKMDISERKISTASGCFFASWKPQCLFIETSAKLDLNVKAIFSIILDRLTKECEITEGKPF